ncbi:hypothetical protein JL720_15177 [Aureococcus anophagefferens]|nr:hypothetical protein JL720_15177 [Aureococcus anophagefferens]
MNAATSKMGTVSGDSHFLEEQMNPTRIKQYLDSTRDYDKAKGMKWLAMMSKGRGSRVDAAPPPAARPPLLTAPAGATPSDFFSDVVKNVVASPSRRIWPLNQLIRAMALRVMTSIRVADIIQIQLLAVRKCASDSSPYAAQRARERDLKIYKLDPDQAETLPPHREAPARLVDHGAWKCRPGFSEVCPDNWALLHRTKLCHLLADVDEWAQIIILKTLARYIRTQFVDPAPGAADAAKALAQRRSAAGAQAAPRKVKRRTVKKAFYSDEEDESQERSPRSPTTRRRRLLALIAAYNKDPKPSDAAVVSVAVVVIRQLLQQGACAGAAPDARASPGCSADVVLRLARGCLARGPGLRLRRGEDDGGAGRGRRRRTRRRRLSADAGATRARTPGLGEYRADAGDLLPDFVRLLAGRFAGEDTLVKMQVVNLAVKHARPADGSRRSASSSSSRAST